LRFRAKSHPGESKKCWCSSGLKAKNCHGVPGAKTLPAGHDPGFGVSPIVRDGLRLPVVPATPTQRIATAKDKPWGVPGEEHNLVVVPRFHEQQLIPEPEETKGLPGSYRI